MIEELVSANRDLDIALARYLRVCTNVKDCYDRRTADVTPGLMARLDTEASSLVHFKAQLKESQAAIRSTRTQYINSLAPINSLPAEILAYIFSIIIAQVRHSLERTLHRFEIVGPLNSHSDLHTAWKYPDILAQVCSHWRNTAIHSRSLWTAVDISILGSSPMNIRAKEHVNRAGQSLLDLYIYDMGAMDATRVDPVPDIIPDSALIRSLRSHTWHPPSDAVRVSVLSSVISKIRAGVLTELILQQYGWIVDLPMSFIEAIDSPLPGNPPVTEVPDTVVLRVDALKQQLEAILLGVTTLRCYEVYPYWTSQAYTNLTELRLLIPHWTGTGVDEIHLVNMLKSSPNLRVLELNRHITNFSKETIADSDRILLSKLEVLKLSWLWNDQTETMLRWLLPISTPLQVSITCDDDFEDDAAALEFNTSATKAFLTRSNITRLHTVASAPDEFGLEDLLSFNAHTLAIKNLSTPHISLMDPGAGRFRLDTLYLLNGAFDIPSLRQLLEAVSVRQIIFHQSEIDIPDQEVPYALTGVCSNVTVIPEEDPDPILDWEFFSPRSSRGGLMP